MHRVAKEEYRRTPESQGALMAVGKNLAVNFIIQHRTAPLDSGVSTPESATRRREKRAPNQRHIFWRAIA
uniref:Uncharacterized protein n=1 Tax=Mycena chlorophos TaxID=658473 RepID=A0ABQ0L505_MYCCL|nr:predicted protein [Mycena chlorophos]